MFSTVCTRYLHVALLLHIYIWPLMQLLCVVVYECQHQINNFVIFLTLSLKQLPVS